ncbi:MAG: FAD-binding protein [Pirellulales bacterium]|nr:FAD-binding protein [Pirellulales bacterium]
MACEKLLDELPQLYGADRLLTRDAQVAPFESDGLTVFRSRPGAVVLPETQEEVIETVRLCHKHDVPFMARGSGTSLSGGAVPVEGGLVIALNRLNRILDYDPDRRIAVVEPGVVNTAVTARVATDGLYYAPDPSSGPICTIGGNVAFNSGGAHCLKNGMTANHVLGIKAVLPDGEVVELGDDSLEINGPDYVGMFCGSEGLFGVALEITLRLLPKPEVFRTIQAAYDSLAKAGDAVAMVIQSGLLPGAMEIMDRLTMEAATAAVKLDYPQGAEAVLIVELEGPREQVDAEYPLLMQTIRESGAYEILEATDEAIRAKIWKGRKSAFSAVGRLTPDFIVQDGVVPRTRLGEALAKIEEIGRRYDCRVANVFHAGDGNLHPLIMFDGRQDGALENAEQCASEIIRLCIEMGGSITGEHGVGLEKKTFLEEMYGSFDVEFMHRLRRAVDPTEIANRGKMLPDAEAASLSGVGPHPLETQGVISRE